MSTATCCNETATPHVGAEDQRSEYCFKPAVDIIERSDELVIVADLPGTSGENVNVEFEDGALTLRATIGQRQAEGTAYLEHEYRVGDYCRTFQIGDAIDADRITAEYADGIVTLHLPKRESLKSRRIEVRTE